MSPRDVFGLRPLPAAGHHYYTMYSSAISPTSSAGSAASPPMCPRGVFASRPLAAAGHHYYVVRSSGRIQRSWGGPFGLTSPFAQEFSASKLLPARAALLHNVQHSYSRSPELLDIIGGISGFAWHVSSVRFRLASPCCQRASLLRST